MSKIKLGSTEAGRSFIKTAVAAAADAGLAFVGEDDDHVLQHLQRGHADLARRLNAELGDGVGDKIVDVIIRTAMGRKHEIEAMPRGRA
jgi:hypothetical protein